MEELKKIKILYDKKVVDAFLLAIYVRECYVFKKTFFEILFRKKTLGRILTVNKKKFLVFIPWKHKLKQITEVEGGDIVFSNENYPVSFVKVLDFVSVGTEELRPQMPVKDFFGYQFIYQNNSFITDQISGEYNKNLDILYSNLPTLLTEEFDEENVD